MKTFLRANIASLTASICDYAATFIFKQFLLFDAVSASIMGTVTGGIINFMMSRRWVFNAIDSPVFHQGKKYLVTWTGNMLLNAMGVYLLVRFAGLYYMIAKVATSLTVAIAYNYPIQKKYVFKNIDDNEKE
jgi:putative flippase GtrA